MKVSAKGIELEDYRGWPLREIKEPHINDFLYGRGGATNHYVGNTRYRRLVHNMYPKYSNAKGQKEKGSIALDLVRTWRSQDPPGRFLEFNKSSRLWTDIGNQRAKVSTSQKFREVTRSSVSQKPSKGKLASVDELISLAAPLSSPSILVDEPIDGKRSATAQTKEHPICEPTVSLEEEVIDMTDFDFCEEEVDETSSTLIGSREVSGFDSPPWQLDLSILDPITVFPVDFESPRQVLEMNSAIQQRPWQQSKLRESLLNLHSFVDFLHCYDQIPTDVRLSSNRRKNAIDALEFVLMRSDCQDGDDVE